MTIVKQDLTMEIHVALDNSANEEGRSARIFEEGDAPRDQTILITDHQSLEYAYEQSLRIKKKYTDIGLNDLEKQILLLLSKLNIQRAHESSKS
jgi:hypothetical protein